ncbi:hypothetical protein VHA01S_032_00260 [Vibrio halioticoli NBRC 102217]|uniref:EpsG family protein n=1 Tax=Vibrio halioticoli NBRC 102217 TaxID=1219072 RepID=V5FK08_9VIBR|nr:EpsG family protein [Vibrio halioticoli]GAD90076.1 hypothetical protein VHA01S_032_00260 [Vibrio halioticoli NBRC 102217]
MFPYYFTFVFCVFCFYLGHLKVNSNEYIVGNKYFILLSIASVILLSTLRSIYVGTDTGIYYRIFQRSDNWQVFFDNISLFSEPGFRFVEFVIKINFNNHVFMLLFVASFVLICTFFVIDKISIFPVLSLICFLLLGFYTFHFNAARQAVAVSLFLLSIPFVLNKQPIKFLAIILLGFLFHKSILLCVPMYYIFGRKLSISNLVIISLFFLIAAFSLDSIVSNISEFDGRYSSYSNSNYESNGSVSVAFNFLVLIWLFIAKRINSIQDKLFDMSIVAMFIACSIGLMSVILSLNPSGILRASVYFTQFMIFALPISIMSFKEGVLLNVVIFLAISFMMIYFYLTTKAFSNLYPYTTNLNFF